MRRLSGIFSKSNNKKAYVALKQELNITQLKALQSCFIYLNGAIEEEKEAMAKDPLVGHYYSSCGNGYESKEVDRKKVFICLYSVTSVFIFIVLLLDE